MINFQLRDLNNISPWGQEPELSLNWFGLTDGDLWLTLGNETIYEYSKEAIQYFGGKSTPYNDYQLSRFIEDFTGIFKKIRESIPEDLYILSKDLKKFQSDAKKWLDKYDTDGDVYSDFYFEAYDKLISWAYQRSFNSAHLIGGPNLYFFRESNKMRIVWATEYTLENGINIWTAKDGSFEMDYFEFIKKIKEFGKTFFSEMEKQVDLAIKKDWEKVNIDKHKLVKEHQERKDDFYSSLSLLEQETEKSTNWTEIMVLFNRMKEEIKK